MRDDDHLDDHDLDDDGRVMPAARAYTWPTKVAMVVGMAPGEMRWIQKVAGAPLDQLETIDQVKAGVFVALVRHWRDAHNGELPDPAEIWDHAEWVQVDPDTIPPPVDPTSTAG